MSRDSWPIATTEDDVRERIRGVLEDFCIATPSRLLDALADAANELWTAERVAEYTGQKSTSVPPWIARHGVPRFTGAVYSRTAVEQAKAAMPGQGRKNRESA